MPILLSYRKFMPQAKANARGPDDDAKPNADSYHFEMDAAEVKFIKAGTNKYAAVRVYDWTDSSSRGDSLVLETGTTPWSRQVRVGRGRDNP